MATTLQNKIKSASEVLAEDLTCQSFIQGSSTLTYACLLIRQKKYELATHVMHSLEAKQASRFKEMVFYLQAQIGIETGEYGMVKKRLLPRVNQNPSDIVALSLLQSCIFEEWTMAEKTQSNNNFEAGASSDSQTLKTPVLSSLQQSYGQENASPKSNPTFPSSPPAMDADFGIYQGLAADGNAFALSLGNFETGRFKSMTKNSDYEGLSASLPEILPGDIAKVCAKLESGFVNKICFSFQNLTVTTFYQGSEYLGLLTGNINQSLLTMVRAENIFQKQAASALVRSRSGNSGSEAR